MAQYAIIIPAFNEEAFLPATLRAARTAMTALPGHRGMLLVVDNHSTDRTADVARREGADDVVFEPINQIARARNAGARHAAALPECEFFVFVDADTHLPAELLAQALESLEAGSTVAGGAITTTDTAPPPHVARLLATWNWFARRLGMAAGSFLFCRRDAFEAVGGFDERVYAGEEVWLSRRLRRWGRKRGLDFRVLSDPPIVTSNRKSEWFSEWDFARQLFLLALCPWTTRSRTLCSLWYQRPSSPP